MRPVTRLALYALFGVIAHPAFAQPLGAEDALLAADRMRLMSPQSSFRSELGLGQVGEDIYANLFLRLSFDQANWGIGVGLPLRLRLIDNEPKSDAAAGIFRKEDWDEAADFFRLLRYVYIGDPAKRGPYYVRLGELWGVSLGHGTIVHRFTNALDLNNYRLGADLAVNVGPFGGEVLVGDMLRPSDNGMLGFRATVRPLVVADYFEEGAAFETAEAFRGGSAIPAPLGDPGAPVLVAQTTAAPGDAPRGADTSSIAAPFAAPGAGATSASSAGLGAANATPRSMPRSTPAAATSAEPRRRARGAGFDWRERLVVGLSLVTDPTAPLALTPGAMGQGTVLTDRGLPEVARHRALVVLGLDVGYELVRSSLINVTPYVDFNNITFVENGWGFHAGVLWTLGIPVVLDTLTVNLKTEYRRVSGDYLSPYFDSAYLVERYAFPQRGASPKLATLAALGTASAKNGWVFDLIAGLPKYVFIGGEFIDYDGGQNDGTLRLSLQVPALEVVRFNAFYLRTGIGGAADLFALDDRSAVVAEAEVPVYGYLSVRARWWRLWRAVEGGFEATDDWSIGVGLNLPL
jgi:hypothetical protein